MSLVNPDHFLKLWYGFNKPTVSHIRIGAKQQLIGCFAQPIFLEVVQEQ